MAKSRRSRLEDGAEDSSLLSLLDTLSNGLGAAVLLGLIFSLSRANESVALSAPEAILVEVSWNDSKALLNLRIRPPWECPGTELDLTRATLESGAVFTQRCDERSVDLVTYGFSQRGTESMTSAQRQQSAMVLILGGPGMWKVESPWHIDLRYFNRSDTLDAWGSALEQRVKVTASITVGDAGRRKRPTETKERGLVVGELFQLGPIVVVAR